LAAGQQSDEYLIFAECPMPQIIFIAPLVKMLGDFLADFQLFMIVRFFSDAPLLPYVG
jgi:hypothetical protein